MKPDALNPPQDRDADDSCSALSSLVDGEAHAIDPACTAWRDDAQARRTWYAYHLIGDVMRSQDLASAPARDADFLVALRARLAGEPVVLAPAAPVPRRQAWLVPAAVAAGFCAVAVVLVVARQDATGVAPPASSWAVNSGPAGTAGAVRSVAERTSGAAPALVRDARLEEFLWAHQATRGVVVVAVPGGTLRRVDMEMPAGAAR